MAGRLHLRLLGHPQVLLDEQPVTALRLRKAEAILFYLAVSGHAHARPALATLLWGDMPEAQAQANLRKALSHLRAVLPGLLLVEHNTIGLNPGLSVDVQDFVAGCARPGEPPSPSCLTAAVALYRGELLDGFYVADAPDYERWLEGERDRLRELYFWARQQLAARQEAAGDLPQAIESLRHVLAVEPWREETQRELMRVLAASGQRGAALAQYEACRRALRAELDVEPGDQTLALYEAIRDGKVGPGAGAVGAKHPPDAALGAKQPPDADGSRGAAYPSRLPSQPTPFVGRRRELDIIGRRLTDPACRLLTLVGPGGIGKTRLSLEAARLLAETPIAVEAFPDGVFFVPLVAATTSAAMVAAISEALDFRFYDDAPPERQLLDYLRAKRLLLVLDNFEQLVEAGGAEWLPELLQAAPGAKLVVTSRESLALQEECLHPVLGLAHPPAGVDTVEQAQAFDAVQLFSQVAARAESEFSLAQEYRHVARICRLVEGMPLGVELAAGWLAMLSCGQVADEIERGLDILSTRLRNVPARHRSLRAVFEHSYRLLAQEERPVFVRLSTFQGGFSREAAGQVAGASLAVLAGLVHKSLLRVSGAGRYQMHELLRQYAADKLAEEPARQTAALDAHRDYYLGAVAARAPLLASSERPRALREIGAEIANIRAAWQRAAGQGRIETLAGALEPLFIFYKSQSRYREGREVFADTGEQLARAGDAISQPGFQVIVESIRARWGVFLGLLGDLDAAAEVLEAALAAARARDDLREVAFTLVRLADVRQTPVGSHLPLVDEALAIYRAIGDQAGITESLERWATHRIPFGSLDQAKQAFVEVLALGRQAGRSDVVAAALGMLGFIAHHRGEYDEAERLRRDSLALHKELGNEDGVAHDLRGIAWTLAAASAEDPQPAAWRRVLPYAQDSIAIMRHIGHRKQLVITLVFSADAANIFGQYETARQWSLEAVSIQREISKEFPAGATWHLAVLAEACYQAGDYAAGRRHLLTALQGYAETPPVLQGEALGRLAEFLALEASSAAEAPWPQQREWALALCSLVAEHQAIFHLTRKRAARLATRLSAALPPVVAAAATGRGRGLTLAEAGAQALAMMKGEG